MDGQQALQAVVKGMTDHTVHTPHPMYYGLYNPRANFAGILADLITAVMNPQLAAWSHSPFASEVEKYLIETFGSQFGYSTHLAFGLQAAVFGRGTILRFSHRLVGTLLAESLRLDACWRASFLAWP